MAWYRTGTVAVTNGSTTVTGTGTAWVANAGAGLGMVLPDGRIYEIAAVVSDTQLTLAAGYLGSTSSGQPYAVVPTRGPELKLVQDITAMVNDYGAAFTTIGQGRIGDGSPTVPALRFSADENTGLYRIGNDILGVSTGGAERVRVNNNGVQVTGTITGSAVNSARYDTTANRLIRNGDHGIGGLVNQLLDPNDAANQTGWFLANTNAPDAAAWFIENLVRLTTGPAFQIASRTVASGASAPRLSARHRGTDLVWSSWAELYHRLNVLGAVGLSGGVPTGALIESGGNANGQYRRFACGAQICWVWERAFTNASTAVGSLFRSAAVNWTFPAAFEATTTPVVVGDIDDQDCWLTAAAPTNTNISLRVMSAVSKASALNGRALAIGRWAV